MDQRPDRDRDLTAARGARQIKTEGGASDMLGAPGARSAEPKHVSHRARLAGAIVLSVFICAAISIDPAASFDGAIRRLDPTASGAIYICYEVLFSFAGHARAIELLALCCLLAPALCRVVLVGRAAWRPSVMVPACLLAVVMVLGRSYDATDSAELVFGGISRVIESLLALAGWTLLAQLGIAMLFAAFDRLGAPRDALSRDGRVGRLARPLRLVLDRRPLLGPGLAIAAGWLPMAVGSAPGIFMGDTSAQILQWFNLPNHLSDHLVPLNPAVLLNGHHPVAHTALLGACVQLGQTLLGSANSGVLIYTGLQFALSVAAAAYAISTLTHLRAGLAVRASLLAFVIGMPMYANYAVLITKDVLFSDAVLLLAIQLVRVLAASAPSRAGVARIRFGAPDVALAIIAASGVTLLRNGGLLFAAVCCASAVPVLLRARSRGLAVGATATLVIAVAVHIGMNGVLMPALDITPGSRREMLSVPFQQTARFVAKHDGARSGIVAGGSDGEVTPHERDVIDRVLDYASLAARYDPGLSDDVKAGFNEHASASELEAYAGVWARMLLRDPAVYAGATISNYYGYLYPSERDAFVYSNRTSDRIMARERLRRFGFHRLADPASDALADLCTLWRVLWQRTPVVSLAMGAPLYVWLTLLGAIYLGRAGRWRSLAAFAPLWCVLAVCFIGPANGSTYLRYLFPLILTAPFALTAALCAPHALE